MYAENSLFPLVQKKPLNHFSVFILEAPRGAGSPWLESHPFKSHGWGAKMHIPVEWPPERDWTLWRQGLVWAAWIGSPVCGADPSLQPPRLPRGRIEPSWHLPSSQSLF